MVTKISSLALFLLVTLTVIATGCNSSSTPSSGDGGGSTTITTTTSGNSNRSASYTALNQCLSPTAAVVGLSDTDIEFHGQGDIQGRVFLLGNSHLNMDGNTRVNDDVYCGGGENHVTRGGNACCTNVADRDYTNHESGVMNFDDTLGSLEPTVTVPGINSSTHFDGCGSVNIINVEGDIQLSGSDTLTLNGGPSDLFLVNVRGNISVADSANILAGGTLPASNIIIRQSSAASNCVLSSSGKVTGTFFSSRGSVEVTGSGEIEGAVFAWNSISVNGCGGFKITPAPYCPGNNPQPNPSPQPTTCPNPNPTPSSSPTVRPSATPTVTPSATPTSSPSPSPTPCTGSFCTPILGA